MACVIAVDAGTTGIRALAVDEAGAVVDLTYRELTQHYPRPGWVEHDPDEIWAHVAATTAEVAARRRDVGDAVAALGVTNQRETVVAWDRRSGRPLHRAVVWQDRRTAGRCADLGAAGHLPLVRERTGLVLDPYFSATKMAWLLETGAVEPSPDLALGTVDAWVVWNLTGGADRGILATDPGNASRTLLYDIGALGWDPELAEIFGVPLGALPEVRPSCGRLGVVAGELAAASPALAGVPVSGVAGDQQAALFGQACFDPGMAKVTYGTGSFVLCNVGGSLPPPAEGLLTSIGWDLGDHAGPSPAGPSPAGSTDAPEPRVTYVLEGAVFATGAAVQWLRDGLGIIAEAAEVGPLAGSVPDSGGVTVVPAFTGLGSPWWDPQARGVVLGLTRGSGRAQVARAVVEAMAFQVRDVVDAMAGPLGRPPAELRADGGAAVLDLLLQLQAEQIRVPVARPATTETTALGAATLAGLAEGVWSSTAELAGIWREESRYLPELPVELTDAWHAGWLRAVDRSRGWVPAEG